MNTLDLVQKTGWLASSALLLTALPSFASSNGLCGPYGCVLVAERTAGNLREVMYQPGSKPDEAAWFSVNAVGVTGTIPISLLGGSDWQPIVGDFDNDYDDDLAVYRDGVFRIEWNEPGAVAQTTYVLPSSTPWGANSIPVVGNWDGIGGDDLGIYTDGSFTLFPDTSDFTDTITIDFGLLPQIPGYMFAQMPFSGPIDDDPDNYDPNQKDRVGIYWGSVAQYATETIDSTYDFMAGRASGAAITQYNRPHPYARAAVVNVGAIASLHDHRLVFMVPPGFVVDGSTTCNAVGYSCISFYPGNPQTQRPVVTPPPDDFN